MTLLLSRLLNSSLLPNTMHLIIWIFISHLSKIRHLQVLCQQYSLILLLILLCSLLHEVFSWLCFKLLMQIFYQSNCMYKWIDLFASIYLASVPNPYMHVPSSFTYYRTQPFKSFIAVHYNTEKYGFNDCIFPSPIKGIKKCNILQGQVHD